MTFVRERFSVRIAMNSRSPSDVPPGLHRCPACGELFDPLITAVMPFCSERCQQIDLGCWFNEEIGLPVEPEDEFDDEPTED